MGLGKGFHPDCVSMDGQPWVCAFTTQISSHKYMQQTGFAGASVWVIPKPFPVWKQSLSDFSPSLASASPGLPFPLPQPVCPLLYREFCITAKSLFPAASNFFPLIRNQSETLHGAAGGPSLAKQLRITQEQGLKTPQVWWALFLLHKRVPIQLPVLLGFPFALILQPHIPAVFLQWRENKALRRMLEDAFCLPKEAQTPARC